MDRRHRSLSRPARPLNQRRDDAVPAEPLEAVIRRRGSSRRFTGKNISFTALSTILDRTDRAIAADFLAPSGASLCDLYLIVNAVDGLPGGNLRIQARARRAGAAARGNVSGASDGFGAGTGPGGRGQRQTSTSSPTCSV